ncbi:MAG: hypothetical protein M3355_12035 [Actinomycetota bacterium]|nr:hypothetical protein [Actinomycetota bacterium]
MRIVVDLAFVVGLALVAAGAGLIYLPAGLIAGGVLLAGGTILHERGSA